MRYFVPMNLNAAGGNEAGPVAVLVVILRTEHHVWEIPEVAARRACLPVLEASVFASRLLLLKQAEHCRSPRDLAIVDVRMLCSALPCAFCA